MLRRFTLTILLFTLLAVPSAVAQTDNKPAKNDYSKGENWLCRPGRQDACTADLTTTIVEASGKLKADSLRRSRRTG